jgi:hypothetical protein
MFRAGGVALDGKRAHGSVRQIQATVREAVLGGCNFSESRQLRYTLENA